MTATLRYDDVEVGTEIASTTVEVHRADLVRYCGASGDFNPIHWDPAFATGVGLPDTIAHGMLTMGQVASTLTSALGDPAAVLSYGVRFTKPIVVPSGPDPDPAKLAISATVTEKLEDNRVKVSLSATVGEDKVLGRATAEVRLR